jgi:hypothetical protein
MKKHNLTTWFLGAANMACASVFNSEPLALLGFALILSAEISALREAVVREPDRDPKP